MIRIDGTYTFYKIQHKKLSGEWTFSNFDYFGLPCKEFGANGDCWQQTGEHAVFEKDIAIQGLQNIIKKHPDEKFRIVEIKISQKTIATT